MRTALLVVVALLAMACGGGGGTTTTGLPARADAISFFTSHAFTGQESPLNDGTPRWLGTGPESAIGEVIGPVNDVSKVGLVVATSSAGGTLTGQFLGKFAPGSNDFLQSVLDATRSGGNQDQNKSISGRIVHIQTTQVGADYLVTVSVAD